MFRFRLDRTVFLLAALALARTATADCTGTIRAATAQEKQSYANAWALFQRAAPSAPDGWEINDGGEKGVLDKEVCAGAGPLTKWTFTRNYSRLGFEARQADAFKKVQVVMQNAQATMRANETKLAAIQKQIDANTQKAIALTSAQKFAEMEAVSKDTARLIDEQLKLTGSDAANAEMKKIGADSNRDTAATFSLTVGETEPLSDDFKPMATPIGKGYRQQYDDDNGIPHADLVAILPTRPGQVGQTVVRVSGDPARAEALLKTAKLQ